MVTSPGKLTGTSIAWSTTQRSETPIPARITNP